MESIDTEAEYQPADADQLEDLSFCIATAPEVLAKMGDESTTEAAPTDEVSIPTDEAPPVLTAIGENGNGEGMELTTEAEEEQKQATQEEVNPPATREESRTPEEITPRKKRKYNKGIFNDEGLSGSYWKTPTVATTEETPSASSRPRRSNAGSLMKTALQEIDRKKKGTSPAKAPGTGTGPGRKSSSTKADEEPGSTSVRKSEPSFRVQPYEKPVTRGRGRPRKTNVDFDDGEGDDSDFETEKKAKGKAAGEKVTPSKAQVRTYGRRSAGATSEEKPKQTTVRTYGGRRRSSHKDTTEELSLDISDSDTGGGSGSAARVSPSTALIAALSIPDELMPTSHEKFLDKFRETQEKSPTPPERRVHNLDEVVATFKSSSRSKKVGGIVDPAEATGAAVPESEQNTPAESSDSEEGDSESASSPSDDKENATAIGAPMLAGAAKGDEAPRTSRWIWWEDEKPVVLQIGPNQLSINEHIVTIDYTNYTKEADVEVPFDPDVLFPPEPKLEGVTPDDFDSNPGTPKLPAEGEECGLEPCKKGCVCESIKRQPLRVEHCGRPKCFLECSCLFNKDHVLIRGDEKNIRSRLRPRVTLLNWKNISKGGNDQDEEKVQKKHKLHKKGKGKKGQAPTEESAKRRLRPSKGVDANAKVGSQKLTRAQAQQQIVYKPGPKSFKPLSYVLANPSPSKSPGKGRGGRAPKKPPALISTRLASNLPILRRIYSCQPCHVQLTKMPKEWSHWSSVESKCASGVTKRVQNPSPSSSVSFHVATSNFKLNAQDDLSYTIVRPNGSILALLYWEAHTKEAPRSIHPHAGNSQEISFPWLYLPLPSSGKVWLFYEIPKYPNDLPAIFLPELGVFLPTDKLMLMTFEANQTGKTSKLYFDKNDEGKMTSQGLLNFVYLVPNLPSLIVYGPVPKTCLRTVNRKSMVLSMRAFEEADECKHLRKKLAAAGTELEVVDGGVKEEFEFPGIKYAPEYEDDFDRDDDLIDESIWETHYQDFMIPAEGYEDDVDDYGIQYDFENGEEVYTDDDEGDIGGSEPDGESQENLMETGDGEGQELQQQQLDLDQEQEGEDASFEEMWEEMTEGGGLEDESEFQEQEDIVIMPEAQYAQ